MTTHEKSEDERLREEEKMIRLFDGSASTIKNSSPIVPLKPLDERREIKAFGQECKQAAKFIFKSAIPRFDGAQSDANLGPGTYEKTHEPQYILKGPKKGGFGSTIPRTTLIFRDVSKSPYKNPSNLESPAPSQYAPVSHQMSVNPKKNLHSQSLILTENSVELFDHNESKMDSNFTSSVQRDFLDSVSRDVRTNPGPGSYLHDQLL